MSPMMMIRDLYVTETKGEKEKILEILGKEKSRSGQTMIQLEDMEFLLSLPKMGEKNTDFNKKVGLCYFHTITYEERVFFNITGSKIDYHRDTKTIHAKTRHSK
jgi:hypothetical protein